MSFQSIAIDALLALSVWATLGSGRLSLAGPGFMACGAYVAFLTGQHVREWFWPCAIASALVAYVLGMVVDRGVSRLPEAPYAIATLSLTLFVPLLASAMHIALAPAHPASNVLFAIVCLAAGLLVLGLAREQQRFAAGAAAAGVAGALYWSTGGSFDANAFGLERMGVMVAVALIGGAGSPLATVLGASLLAVLVKIATPLTDQPLIVDGIALILALIYLPGGAWPPLVAAVRSISRPRESLTDGAA